jgi:predicted NBD/HSP70 family sugar kinase
MVPARRSLAGLGLVVNINYIAAALVDLSGDVVVEAVRQGDYRLSAPAEVLAELRSMTGRLLDHPDAENLRIAGAYVGIPGLIEAATGLLTVAPNLNWYQVPVAELLDLDSVIGDRRIGNGIMQVGVANDAKLAALAEVNLGAVDTFLYVSADQGIGGAIVVNGELFGGQHGWSGEIGHVVVDPAGPACGCGAYGCLEVYASLAGLMSVAGLPPTAPIAMLVSRLEDDDAAALAALEQAKWSLGAVLADMVNVFDISTVVIGGELIPLVPYLEESLTAQINHRVLSAPYVAPVVTASQIGQYPALIGAAREGLRAVIEGPALWV